MFLSHKISVDKHFINNIIEELSNELNAKDDVIKEYHTKLEESVNKLETKNNILSSQCETIRMSETPDETFRNYKITKKEFLYNIQKGRCCYCDKKISIDKMTSEHLIPKSLGGTKQTGNIALACKKCNSKRGSNIYCSKSLEILQTRASRAWWNDFYTTPKIRQTLQPLGISTSEERCLNNNML